MSRHRFCKLTKTNRSTFYYRKKTEAQGNIDVMNKMDEYYSEHPTAGVRTMRSMLLMQGIAVNEKRVRRLMRKMGIQAIYPQKKLTKQGQAKYVHPYLLKGKKIDSPDQVWSTDITYVPMRHGYMYLYAVIDVHSRYIVGWRFSNTLDKSNCIELMEECIAKHGKPEIVNTDQGSQYTSADWINTLEGKGISISMDGRGRCKDNIWIERFWRTIKQEYIYRYPTDVVSDLRAGIGRYMEFYNELRPHQSLGNATPPSKIYRIKDKAA